MLNKRVNERFDDFINALNRLKDSIIMNIENDVVLDGIIQRFEFTFEMAWKLMKAYLEIEGVEEALSPRSTIRAAFKYGLVESGEEWIIAMIDKNKTSHTYDEKTALEIYENVKNRHISLFEHLAQNMRKKIMELE